MVKCGHVGLQFRVRDKVRVSVRDRIGVRVREGLSNLCVTGLPRKNLPKPKRNPKP